MISTRTVLALLLCGSLAAAANGQEDSPGDWEQLMQDSEASFEWSEDPLADLGLDPLSAVFWSTSVRGGPGYSSNFLKRNDPVSSRYLQLEGDFYLNRVSEKTSLSTLFFFESSVYDRDTEADSEAVAFLQSSWERTWQRWALGLDLEAFYGDQIFDASLSEEGRPVGDRLRQFRTEPGLYVEWLASAKDLIHLRLGYGRACFEDDFNDYQWTTLESEWTRSWTDQLDTVIHAGIFQESYDENVARIPTGLPVTPEKQLKILGLRIEQELVYRQPEWHDFRISLRAGISDEDEETGEYESAWRYWVSLSTKWEFAWFDLRLNARHQEIRYRDRYSSLTDRRPARQVYQSAGLEIQRSLPWQLSLIGRAEWNDFSSRDERENFTERRVELLLEWTY